MPGDVKVYVDSMLGWLARWLRMVGVDAVYSSGFSDEELMNIEGLLVTRDRGLFFKRDNWALLLLTNDHTEWLATVLALLGVEPRVGDGSRCPVCGGKLIMVDSREAVGKVPDDVVLRFSRLYKCTVCGKYYWTGSHHRGIEAELEHVKELLKKIKLCMKESLCTVYVD